MPTPHSTKIRQMISSRAQLMRKDRKSQSVSPSVYSTQAHPELDPHLTVSMDGKRLLINHADEEMQAPPFGHERARKRAARLRRSASVVCHPERSEGSMHFGRG